LSLAIALMMVSAMLVSGIWYVSRPYTLKQKEQFASAAVSVVSPKQAASPRRSSFREMYNIHHAIARLNIVGADAASFHMFDGSVCRQFVFSLQIFATGIHIDSCLVLVPLGLDACANPADAEECRTKNRVETVAKTKPR